MNAVRPSQRPLPVLFHGTTLHRARRIVVQGFRRSKTPSYTGTAVNLSESICLAWEYGPPCGGKILEVVLEPGIRWRDADRLAVGERYDDHFASAQLDALRTYGGNVWLLWTVERARVRVLSLPEIMLGIVAHFRRDGPGHGYNGDVDGLATLFWHGEDAAYAELRIAASQGFDVERWKRRTLGRYRFLLALAGVQSGDGRKGDQ
jgi:hypothetical protein